MSTKRSWMRLLALCLGVAGLALATTPQALAGGTSIKGTVTEVSGAPVASVWVVFTRGETEAGKSLTGDDGKYYVGGLARGHYTVIVRTGDQVLYRGSVQLPTDGAFDMQIG